MSVDVHLYKSWAATKNRWLKWGTIQVIGLNPPQLSMFYSEHHLGYAILAYCILYHMLYFKKKKLSNSRFFVPLWGDTIVYSTFLGFQTCDLLTADIQKQEQPMFQESHQQHRRQPLAKIWNSAFSTAHHWLWSCYIILLNTSSTKEKTVPNHDN